MKRFFPGLLQAVLFCVICYGVWVLVVWALQGFMEFSHPILLTVFSIFPAVMMSTVLLLRFPYSRSFATIALPSNRLAISHSGIGLGIGAGSGLLILAIQWIVGWVEIRQHVYSNELTWTPALGFGIAVIAIGAAGEELLFRGYGLQFLMRATNPVVSIVGTSLLFGWLHHKNPNFSTLAAVNTILFGFLFGVALVRFRTLWLPFGIHCGWNCALAGAGAKLSGLKVRLMEMEIVETGPTFWTGGAYGPEGSPITTIFVAVLIIALGRAPISANSKFVTWDPDPAEEKEQIARP